MNIALGLKFDKILDSMLRLKIATGSRTETYYAYLTSFTPNIFLEDEFITYYQAQAQAVLMNNPDKLSLTGFIFQIKR